jgi:hypothetical protein
MLKISFEAELSDASFAGVGFDEVVIEFKVVCLVELHALKLSAVFITERRSEEHVVISVVPTDDTLTVVILLTIY